MSSSQRCAASNGVGAMRGFSLLLAGLIVLLTPAAHARDTVYYYYTNTLHSAVVETDAQGNIVEPMTYYAPFGQVLNRSLRDGPGYTGHEEDPETGLSYMQQRYYDPQSGRFLSTDPVLPADNGGNFNRYWYANDNPYRFTDPFGLYACGSKVSSGDCGKIDKFVGKINQSLKGLNKSSSDYKALSAVSKFLGTKDDGNGVTIETASLKENVVGQAVGLKTMQLDMKQIGGVLTDRIAARNPGMSAKDANVIAGGSTIAHETQHLIDANRPKFDPGTLQFGTQGPPTTRISEMATERRAYGIEGSYGRGLGADVGYSTPAQIEAGAQASCQETGLCK